MTEPVGLRRGSVRVAEHNPRWAEEYEKERRRLQGNLGGALTDVAHIGSTAVPGLAAKPIIDIIAAVDDLSVYKQLIKPLTFLGYEYMPERVFDDRVFFPKGPRSSRTHHLSLVLRDSPGWIGPIAFRDYLRSNLHARHEYQSLKLKLAAQYPFDRSLYTAAKTDLIRRLQAEARLL